MSNDLNQCNFIGRLGQDPETKSTQGGETYCRISLAVGWKGKNSEGVEWVPVVFFGKLAEICGQYLKKGSRVYMSGKFKTRKWTDNNNVERYTTEIVASDMQMLDSPRDSTGSPQSPPAGARNDGRHNANGTRTSPYASNPGADPGFDNFDDDIPF